MNAVVAVLRGVAADLLRRLDGLPTWAAAAGGGVLGAGAVGGLLAADHAVATGAALLVVCAGVALARTGESRWVERRGVEKGPAPPARPRVVEIPATTFWMGSPDGEGRDNEHPRHEVSLSPYAIGVTVVTQGQWADVMGGPTPKDPLLPKVEVSWFDALRFCNAASKRAGLRACYRQTGKAWTWDREADGYRLPTEAEWECAARAGTETRWSCGDDEDRLPEFAWYGEPWNSGAHPVAQKAANPWGLYDVHGNVWEWCWDAYDKAFYARSTRTDPVNDADDIVNKARVIRGGSFFSTADWARSAGRDWFNPGVEDGNLGFRCVRSPLPQPS